MAYWRSEGERDESLHIAHGESMIRPPFQYGYLFHWVPCLSSGCQGVFIQMNSIIRSFMVYIVFYFTIDIILLCIIRHLFLSVLMFVQIRFLGIRELNPVRCFVTSLF